MTLRALGCSPHKTAGSAQDVEPPVKQPAEMQSRIAPQSFRNAPLSQRSSQPPQMCQTVSHSACAVGATAGQMEVALGIFFFMLLVGVGTAVFKMSGHMSWIDAFYLTVVSSSTVGYGEPSTARLR